MEQFGDSCPTCNRNSHACQCPYVPDTPAELLGRFVLAAFIVILGLVAVVAIFSPEANNPALASHEGKA